MLSTVFETHDGA